MITRQEYENAVEVIAQYREQQSGEKSKEIIEKIVPYLNSDGGNLEFIKLEDNIVYIKLTGACGCCPHKNETIKYGILESIKEEIPEIKDVINVEI